MSRKTQHNVFVMQAVRVFVLTCALAGGALISACAPMSAPDPRSISIPAPTPPEERRHALNEVPDGVMIVPLGEDVLVPQMDEGDPLPNRVVGPFELRRENLAGALQLILADYDIPLAFESDKAMSVGVTVSNLKGPLDRVVEKVCSLANLYCLYDEGVLTVKDSQTFTVSLPPLPSEATYDSVVTGLKAFTGAEGTIDSTTRTMIYSATERTAQKAVQYFERLRKSTAMIVYETYIWEVGLNGGNSSGIKWTQLGKLGAYNLGMSLSGSTVTDLGTPISIGLPTRGAVNFSTGDILKFISTQGAVKTISQPQLTVLSGSEATLRVAETEAYVESLTSTQNASNDTTSVSTTTGKVDTGFTLKIGSSWDDGTVYGNVDINLQQLLEFQDFPAGNDGTLRLPKTAEREVQTQVRVRPGDSVLIAGLVRERQQYDKTGVGLQTPILPFSRSGQTQNTELVILLRPRVIVYKPVEEIEQNAQSRARLALSHADVPEIAHPSQPEGIPSAVLARKIAAPKPYDPAADMAPSAAAAPSVVTPPPAATPAPEPSGLSLDDMDPASSGKPAVDIQPAPVPPPPASGHDAPKDKDAPAVTGSVEGAPAGTLPPLGSLPSSLLDPSLGAVL